MTQRTPPQNRSLHKWATMLADEFNAAGFDQRAVLNKLPERAVDIPWTMEAIKNIVRTVGHAMYGVESTADLTTTQMQEVYKVVDARLSEITGIRVEWPSLESQMMEEYVPGEDRKEEPKQQRYIDNE